MKSSLAICFWFIFLQNCYQRHFVLAGLIAVITNIWHLFDKFIFYHRISLMFFFLIFQDEKKEKEEKLMLNKFRLSKRGEILQIMYSLTRESIHKISKRPNYSITIQSFTSVSNHRRVLTKGKAVRGLSMWEEFSRRQFNSPSIFFWLCEKPSTKSEEFIIFFFSFAQCRNWCCS